MTKYFVAVFLGMAIYGLVAHKYGPAMLSLAMAGFTLYGHRELRKRDIEFYLHPRSAKSVPSTEQLLDQYNCEAS